MSSPKIKKAVIPAAGKGTRFLPATKSVEKELLPIVDTPTIQLIVEEVNRSGIETLILVTGKGKDSIRDHFDYSRELEAKLVNEGKQELARRLHEQTDLVNIVSIRQQEQLGLGHAIWCAAPVVGDEPFVVLLGDDLVLNSEVPCTKQMIDQYDKYQKSVVALMEVEQDEVSKFGICAGRAVPNEPRTIEVEQMVEKPKANLAPSRDAIVGRYVLSPKIFSILDEMVTKHELGAGGEIQLTDALDRLRQIEGVLGYKFLGERFDAGSKDGWLRANLCMAMKRPELCDKLLPYMKKLLSEYSK
jgi:UTP--glucose-1-phosphate uridylyltransferase